MPGFVRLDPRTDDAIEDSSKCVSGVKPWKMHMKNVSAICRPTYGFRLLRAQPFLDYRWEPEPSKRLRERSFYMNGLVRFCSLGRVNKAVGGG